MKLGTKVWGVITFVVAVALVAGGWFLGVSPLLGVKATADKNRTALATQNDVLAGQIAALEAKKAELPELQDRAVSLERSVPSEVDGAAFIRDLNDLANASGVTIQSIVITDGSVYGQPADGTDVEGAPVPVTDPLITSENFVLVPVTVTVAGGWNELLAFSHALQTGQRLVLVTSISSSAGESGYQFILGGTMYALQRPGGPVVDTTADTAGTATEPAAG